MPGPFPESGIKRTCAHDLTQGEAQIDFRFVIDGERFASVRRVIFTGGSAKLVRDESSLSPPFGPADRRHKCSCSSRYWPPTAMRKFVARLLFDRDLRGLSEEPIHGLIESQAPVSDSDCVPSFRAP